MMPVRLVLFISKKKYYNEIDNFLRELKKYEKNKFNY